ncbi:uncharacterized protein Z518_01625 [Rhinocladiella mackenziei CBS 650.93]|uniref:Protein FAF1 n=1 Tax=Rhinocladiella mackenziei CBS 650.93 TaxID=1442369 RepID=A0A0D2G6G5_9EURO|nr:uncharacterized protein Z518_01625 [Rhinocladiella mackenziei CBS 650.93]KIX10542.1 hypothetical protein Z518_01625 [Rhinocladiella mackenziei CBS 650.93]
MATTVAVARRPQQHTIEQPPTTTSSAERDVFRKYFESAFEPLPESQTDIPYLQEDEDDVADHSEEESEWEGLSDAENDSTTVEVVEHRTILDETQDHELQRQRYKSFMSSRPPKEVEPVTTKSKGQPADGEDASEAMNLKHDLDLQRLLKESHLLEQAKVSSTPGSHRHKAVDMRLRSLGSKGSMFHQVKMPLAHRRGILAKSASRETMRRKEAQENGIIVEKPEQKRFRSGERRRERAVDIPAVGKFRGGTLKLSKKDVLDIQGPVRPGGRGKKGR